MQGKFNTKYTFKRQRAIIDSLLIKLEKALTYNSVQLEFSTGRK